MFALFDYSKVVESGRSASIGRSSGSRLRRRIADMFALFDYSKAAEPLSVHGHAAAHVVVDPAVRWWEVPRPTFWQH